MENARIARIESATLLGMRPRVAGNNARLNIHGIEVHFKVLRLTSSDGASGFGLCLASREEAQPLLGEDISRLLTDDGRIADAALAFDCPLWDLAGKLRGKPVYALVGSTDATTRGPLRVPCYDTSLYMNDLHLDSDEAGAALIAGFARQGYEDNHRSFKIKVGRGGRHMQLEAGNRRDIAVIKAVREAVGSEATIMIDANNGYNLNIAKAGAGRDGGLQPVLAGGSIPRGSGAIRRTKPLDQRRGTAHPDRRWRGLGCATVDGLGAPGTGRCDSV